MQSGRSLAVFLFLATSSAAAVRSAEESTTNPIQKIIELLSGLQAKIIADGEAEVKQFNEYFEWCDDATKEKQFEIKTLSAEAEDLKATIEKATSDISVADDKIGELSSAIATNEADLKSATDIRKKENADFRGVEAELMDDVDALGRAIKILEKHASLLQGKNGRAAAQAMKELTDTFQVLLQAGSLSVQDKASLTELLQTKQQETDQATEAEDEGMAELGAPAPAVYKSKSGGIVDVLEDMLDKAETELSEARKEESNAAHNYNMLKQSLSDQIKFDNEELEEQKKGKAAAQETKATAEGDLEATSADLAEAEKILKTVGMECMTAAHEHDLSRQSRAEELKALATAKKIIQKMTAGGAAAGAANFLQMSSKTEVGVSVHMGLRTRQDLLNYEAVNVLKRVALAQHSVALAQLASRMEAAVHVAQRTGEDPFAKVKGMISDMIEKLLKEAAEEASHKAWCDEEMGETKAKKEKLTTTVEDLTVKIDKATATIEKLTEEVAQLQEELAALAQLQAEMDKMRAEENETFKVAEADLSQGLEGVRMALKVLRDYYAKSEDFLQENDFRSFMQQPKPPAGHSKSSGAAGGIIGMLEVAESDFAKNLAEARAVEEQAQEEYEKTTQENKIAKTTKEQDVKYKNKEKTSLEKMVAEATEDRTGSQTELDAVLEYWDKLKEQCIAKPEPYEERKKRREAEIAGLKEALSILEGEAFVQTSRGFLQGMRSNQE